jgi:hypothetical protein
MWANGQLIKAEQAFKILLVISSQPDEFFDLRECIILFISVSVVGIILMPGNFTGNASFKNEIASSLPT